MRGSIRAYRAGVAIAGVASGLIIWTSIVRDDGHAAGSFMVILAAVVGAFAASWEAAGLARTTLGVAVMQVLLGLLTATAPIVAKSPGGSVNALLFNGAFALMWLGSAACFWRAASRPERLGSAVAS